MNSIQLAKQLAWAVTTAKTSDFHSARTLVKHFYSGSRAINSTEVGATIKKLPAIADMIYDHSVIGKFEKSFGSWLEKNKYNTLSGLENFEPDISQGATQAFDSFYIKHANRHWKMFYGEYFYHTLTAINLQKQWSFIQDHRELNSGDVLMISVPFCDTGNQINNIEAILDHCDQHNVPVLIDCAYYTIARDIELNLNHSCIDTVVFSLSKTFPVAHARVGMRYTRLTHRDGQKLHSKINYDNRVSAAVGLYIIDQYSSDWVVDRYYESYLRHTDLLNLTPGNSIMFAEGNDSWVEYSRKSLLETYGLDLDYRLFKNRICLAQLLENGDIVDQCLKGII
jgi:hypothetical protein